IVTAVALGLTLLLPPPGWRLANLPRIVFPIAALFCAAVYLMSWKLRSDAFIDMLTEARRQVTILEATAAELRIETSGPFGSASHRIRAADVLAIQFSQMGLRNWWKLD